MGGSDDEGVPTPHKADAEGAEEVSPTGLQPMDKQEHGGVVITKDGEKKLDARLEKGLRQLELMENDADFTLVEPKNWAENWWLQSHNGIRLQLKDMYLAVAGIKAMKKEAEDRHLQAFFEWFAGFEEMFRRHLDAEEMAIYPIIKSKLNPRPKFLPSDEEHVQLGLKLTKIRVVSQLIGTKKAYKIGSELERVVMNFILLALENLRTEEKNEVQTLFTHGNEEEDVKKLDKAMADYYGKEIGELHYLQESSVSHHEVHGKQKKNPFKIFTTKMQNKPATQFFEKQKHLLAELHEAAGKDPNAAKLTVGPEGEALKDEEDKKDEGAKDKKKP